MTILPQIAEDNPSLTIVLISLQGAEYTRKYLHAMPDNIHVLVARDDGKEVLKAFGNETRAMPFSVGSMRMVAFANAAMDFLEPIS